MSAIEFPVPRMAWDGLKEMWNRIAWVWEIFWFGFPRFPTYQCDQCEFVFATMDEHLRKPAACPCCGVAA